ncbi:MAG TPA: (2Fe-2S) ferredoxin domain-containing protein [Candidatus Kapabacteria bacterium]|jgi:(2Fe-2S) ferredoxin|nr:(2Fe-2S) ferredoxin domain-containing protein [Candidatus Kapabacteria bacterium]
MRYAKHVFICTNERDPADPRGCCSQRGGNEVRDAFKRKLKERGLHGRMRANASGCLDACEFGPSIVVYPDCIWYGGVSVEDIDEIIESHLINDVPVERLLIRDRRYLPPDVA